MDFSAKATPERGRLLLAPPVLYATAPLLDSTPQWPLLLACDARHAFGRETAQQPARHGREIPWQRLGHGFGGPDDMRPDDTVGPNVLKLNGPDQA